MSSEVIFTKHPDAASTMEAMAVGFAATLSSNAGRGGLSVNSMLAWIRTPIRLGQCLILMSASSQPLGMAVWAYVSEETHLRLARGEQDLPTLEDWNEGTIFWIVDIVAPYGHIRDLAAELRRTQGATHRSVHYFRKGCARRIRIGGG
ncbi:toxin-activating lysine-acyltransferase [Sphingomonas bacterium]|uniref:toxin-activating lysine-acyltransferase n=1 Tax=Sphingomonas bacterium TaxID=1895847 RepID=UPI0015772FF7|nr:toxin-activating lysine-acyltransferase [Sphingomonas bacterium]